MRTKLLALAALSLTSGLALGQSGAEAPTLNITAPTAAGGALYLGAFPSTLPIQYTVQANGGAELKNLTQLNASVNGVSLYGGQMNPFTNTNACVSALTTAPNTCFVSSSTNASLSVPWTISAIGDYTLIVTARYQNAAGSDEEVVTVALVSAEYPAPPSVANAYINAGAGGLPLSGKQRGCVISRIAEQHAKYETYGPKGGPYNELLIHSAVGNFATVCPAR
jgi:hypothetical protein